MASVEQTEAVAQNGGAPDGIPVENPATGAIIATVPKLSAEQVAEMAARGRAAQPGWEALGFEGRGEILLRAQKWVMDNAERVIETIVSETGKTYEDAQLAEIAYAGSAFGFWAKNAPEYLADEKLRTSSVFVKGKKLVIRYAPVGLVGVIGPWNFPLTNSFGDCIPALAAGNAVILKPSEVTPLTSLLMERGAARVRSPRERLPGRHRGRRDGRGARSTRSTSSCSRARRRPGRRCSPARRRRSPRCSSSSAARTR